MDTSSLLIVNFLDRIMKEGEAIISSTSSHILAVGVPSMTECSPMIPALASSPSQTISWTGLSTHLLASHFPPGEPPCQSCLEKEGIEVGVVSSRQTKNAEECISLTILLL